MEWLSTILTSSNAILVMGFVLILVGIIIFGIKKGWFSFEGKGLRLGYADKEREIIRHQIEFIRADTIDLVSDMPQFVDKNKMKTMDIYKAKYTMELVYDEFVNIISFNHISKEDTYIQLKQKVIWGIVAKECPDWPELEEPINKRVEYALKKLADIRTYYTNGGI